MTSEGAMDDDPGSRSVEGTRPLFGVWGTLVVALGLVVPFAIYTFAETEPYPAVIFPGGGQIATHLDGNRARFEVSALVGFDDSGAPVRLDPTSFLDPVPPSFAGGLIGTRFGQETSATTTISISKLGQELELARHVPSSDERLAARQWVSARLEEAGLDPDRLEVHHDEIVVDHSTGEVLERRTVEEVVILD